MQVVLTMIDTARIQDYVFASNRLRENIGASYLVEQATRDWVYDALKELGGHNIKDSKPDEEETARIDRGKRIEQDGRISELIFAGGGNTAILFRSSEDAKTFAWNLSRRIFEEAPGLEIVIAHSEEFDWDPDKEDLPSEERLRDQVDKLRKGRLAEKKRTRQATPTPLLGLSVAAECEATGLVATRQTSKDLEPEPRFVSRETIQKLGAREEANDRLTRLFAKVENIDEFEFSDELDRLGRTGGEESYIAVVHIDGNGMGEVIEEYVGKAKTNREYIERMRDFSEGVERASRAALVRTLRILRHHIAPDRDPRTRRIVQYVMEAIPASTGSPPRNESRFGFSTRKKRNGRAQSPAGRFARWYSAAMTLPSSATASSACRWRRFT